MLKHGRFSKCAKGQVRGERRKSRDDSTRFSYSAGIGQSGGERPVSHPVIGISFNRSPAPHDSCVKLTQ